MQKHHLLVRIIAAAATFICCDQASAQETDWNAYQRYVDGGGNIALPSDFDMWVHLGTWTVVEDNLAADLHSVYVPREHVEHFIEHGDFADGAMMVKEVRHAKGAEHTTGRAFWAEDIIVRFVMVKDTKGRFPENPLWGDGWGWALFKGEDETTQHVTDYKTDCLGCHIPAKETDYTYVYAYPILGKEQRSHGPSAVFGKAQADIDPMSAKVMDTLSDEDRAALVKRGEKVFRRCKSCHKLAEGKHGSGPSLAGVFGRRAGSAEGYNYSDAMKNSDVVWNAETLNEHLLDVAGFIPGNKMAKMFRAGVKKETDRRAVIEYLRDK